MAQKQKRYTLYYSPDDERIANWLKAQNQPAMSLRRLIYDAVSLYGYDDIFDVLLSLPGNGRGRVQEGRQDVDRRQEARRAPVPETDPHDDEAAQMPPKRPDRPDDVSESVEYASIWEVSPYDGGDPDDREATRKEKLHRSMQNMIDGGR